METNNVRLWDLLGVLDGQVHLIVTDKYTREPIKLSFEDKNTLNRNVYRIFQNVYDETLNVVLS